MTILVVDDDRTFRDRVSCYLNRIGFDTVEACCVEAACDILRAEAPTLVVTDYRMDDGTGLDVASEAEALDIPCFMHSSTANTVRDDRLVHLPEVVAQEFPSTAFAVKRSFPGALLNFLETCAIVPEHEPVTD